MHTYKNTVKIMIGFLFIVTVMTAYIPQPEYLIELTCVSNTLGGFCLISDGIIAFLKKKKLPAVLYQNVCVSILLVFIVCMASLSGIFHFNFKGAFFFLHVVNPIVFLGYYLFSVNEMERRARCVSAAPVLVIIYFLFDYILGTIRGNFVYGFVETSELNLLYAVITGVVIYAVVCLLGFAVFYLNRLVHKVK